MAQPDTVDPLDQISRRIFWIGQRFEIQRMQRPVRHNSRCAPLLKTSPNRAQQDFRQLAGPPANSDSSGSRSLSMKHRYASTSGAIFFLGRQIV